MKAYSHISFDTAASVNDRYFGAGYYASQYAVQMMQPGRIIGFRAYGSTDGEQTIIQDVTPDYFASGDRLGVYVYYNTDFDMGFLEVRKNGTTVSNFVYSWFYDVRNQAWNATVLVEYL